MENLEKLWIWGIRVLKLRFVMKMVNVIVLFISVYLRWWKKMGWKLDLIWTVGFEVIDGLDCDPCDAKWEIVERW